MNDDKEKNKQYKEDDIEIVAEDDSLEKKIRKLRDELKECKQARDEYLAGWQRSRADFINSRKDEEKSREEFRRYSELTILEKFMDLADNFEMAFVGSEKLPKDVQDWMTGMNNIYSQMIKIFEEYGISKLKDSLGKKFNPQEHEAIERVAVDNKAEDNVILEELRRGYKMHDKIIRPSKVKVGVYDKS